MPPARIPRYNQFSGPLPQRFSPGVESLLLHSNGFTGTLPKAWAALKKLKHLGV
jgi:hypothetical protein